VKLDGERADIEEFPHRFPDGDVHAIEKDGSVYVAGPGLERLVDATQVRERAVAAVDEMSAVISILWPHFRKPSVGNVQREDDRGGVGNWMFPVVGELRIKARYKVRANGTVYLPADPQRPTDAQRLLIASRATSHLRTAVLLWAFPDRAWWLLYRVVEDIETHLNELDIATSVSEAGYCPGKERARFRHSANSAAASGLGARHAAGKWDPPTDPMSLEDATIFVKGLLEQALRDGRV
jgi:hypothetical protein